MNYLVDTCVFSEFKKLRPERRVIDWFDSHPDDSLFLSVLTIGEIEKGIIRMPESKRKADLALFLETLVDRFDRRTLNVDTATAHRWGQLIGELESKGRVLPVIDSLLAATALQHDLTVVTRNEDDFAAAGVRVLNLWD